MMRSQSTKAPDRERGNVRARLDNRVQGYSLWVSHADGKPIQTGVSPDRTGVISVNEGAGS